MSQSAFNPPQDSAVSLAFSQRVLELDSREFSIKLSLSIAIMEMVILTLFSAWLLGMVHRGEVRLIWALIGPPLLELLLLAALYLFPLPLDLTKGLLPEFFHPPDAMVPGPSYRPFSLYPYATRASLVLGLSYAAIFLLVLHGIHTRQRLKEFLNILVGVGFLLGLPSA